MTQKAGLSPWLSYDCQTPRHFGNVPAQHAEKTMTRAYLQNVDDRGGQRARPGGNWRRARPALLALTAVVALGVACSDDESEPGQCIGGLGATQAASPKQCGAPAPIGECVMGAVQAGEEHDEGEEAHDEGDAGAGDHHEDGDAGEAHEHEEGEHPIQSGREADDDNCKYHVRFENTCVAVDQPVTFTLSLTRLSDGEPGAGTNPAFPEIYLADEPTHLSPSNDITANERSPGTYEIGPVVFDRSGRWVVRFHYFDTCSEIPEDSPHSHVAFYFDVP